MPYAYSKKIEHEFDTDHLNIWLTFKHPMRRSSNPLAVPPVYDIMPPLNLWILKCDTVAIDIVASEWVDEFTLLLTSDTVAAMPNKTTLAYNGPNENLTTTWLKQWEPWGDTESNTEKTFIDRGDPAVYDFTQATLTTDDTWQDLDLSTIIPAGAKAVILRVCVNNSTPETGIYFRKKGNVNAINMGQILAQTSNVWNESDIIVALDSTRHIEYNATNTTWAGILILVKGWLF